MTLEIIKNLILELSDTSLNSFKQYSEKYCSCYFLKYDELSTNEFIEKIFEYLKNFEYKNGVRDNDLIPLFVSDLFSDIEKVAEKESKVEKYIERANKIRNTLKKYSLDDKDLCADLETFSKIYLTIVNELVRVNYKKISNISFNISVVKIDKVIEFADEKKIGLLGKFKKKDTLVEIVHDAIEKEEEEKIYSKRSFALLVLILLYLRITDYEMGGK